MTLSRDQMITSTIDNYFERLNAHDLDGVMRGMTEQCEMRIPSSGFTYTGAKALRTHLGEFLDTFETVDFRNFVIFVDTEANRVGTYFDVGLRAHDGEALTMSNANFFELNADGLITDILIIASAPLSRGFQAGNSN
jgi:ketosteroid isomerase-like protein